LVASWLGLPYLYAYEAGVPVIDEEGREQPISEQRVPLADLDFVNVLVVGADAMVRHVSGRRDAPTTFRDIPLPDLRCRTDVIMLVGFDRRTGSVRLLHIPRDTIITVPGHGTDKISLYLCYKENSFFDLKKLVEDMVQLPVHRYVMVDFGGFKEVVDAIGGVTVTVDHDLRYPGGVWLPKGTHRLDGARALQFVRHRYGENRADIDRIRFQYQFIVAMAKELKSGGILKVLAAYRQSPKVVKTNVALGEITALYREWRDFDPDTIQHYFLPGRPESHYWRIDPEGARRVIEQFWPDEPTLPPPPAPPGDESPRPPTGRVRNVGDRLLAGLAGLGPEALKSIVFRPFLHACPGAGQPPALIYHTHATESFMPELFPDPDERAAHDPNRESFSADPELNVTRVGRELVRALEELGFDACHLDNVHDPGGWAGRSGAYARSKATALAVLERTCDPVLILDVHRDAVTETVRVGEQPAAGILLVVARQNAWWQWNYAFAKHLGARLNAVAPGLCRGVRILDGRYNQDLSPLALIVEVGGAQSTMEECLVSARILAGAVSDLLGGP